MTPDALLEKIERDILSVIEEKLVNGQIDPEKASAIAKMVLEKLHPPLTLERVYAIVPTLDDEFQELAKAILPIQKEHEKKVVEVVARHAEQLIKEGKFDEATAILKQATDGTSVAS